MKMMKSLLRTIAANAMFLAMFSLCLTLVQGTRCHAQDQTHPQAPTKVAKMDDPGKPSSEGSAAVESKNGELPAAPPTSPDPEISPAVARELAAMKAEIEQLKAELRSRDHRPLTFQHTAMQVKLNILSLIH